jgi:small-conductance mechanosensitive channel
MANPIHFDNMSSFMTSLVQMLQEKLLNPVGFMQIGTIGVTYLLAWLFAGKVRQHLEKHIGKDAAHRRFALSPVHFAILLKYFFWLLLLRFCHGIFKRTDIPFDVLNLAVNIIFALLVVRFTSFYIKSTFWSRFIYVVFIIVLSLQILNLWGQTVHLLDSMTIALGKMSISIWGLIEAIFVLILLLAVAGTANRFIAQWLTTSTKLTYSDRTFIQRVINAAMVVLVILISLRSAGIHLAAILVTGGALGFAVGMGLQKIGSNLVSGLMLLIRKPIRQGDVIAFEKGFVGADYGWVTKLGPMYVHVATRDGIEALIPNERFMTQIVKNLSYSDNLLRLHIPFGISYGSDLKKAIAIAINAAMSIDRILKVPGPICRVREFGDSSVNLQLRVWINDPRNGTANITDAVLLALWDGFHANGIEIAFPQRDLHIKSAVPLNIYNDNPRPMATDPPANEE